MSSQLPPGTLVDVRAPYANGHKWVWSTGYQILHPKEVNEKHKKLLGKKEMMNPDTKELEPCVIVRNGAYAFPVLVRHVRRSSPHHKDIWNPEAYIGAGVRLKGFIIADESDKADVRSLDEVGK